MSRFADQTIEIAIAHLPPALLPPKQAETLRRAAGSVASGRQLYFEVRLAGDDRAVDLSQHFFTHGGGPAALLALAERHRGDAWHRLAAVAADWPDDLSEIGLEQDLDRRGQSAPPAVFAAFDAGVLASRESARRFIDTVTPAAGAAWNRLIATLEHAEDCGLTGGRLIGAMLSRDGQLRCMVRGLTVARAEEFLARIGWPGDRDALLGLLGQPVLAGEATRLVLGFAPDLVPDCGIEIIHPRGAEGDATRARLLDWLVGQDLAERARVAALAEWPQAITPLTAAAIWPDAMIARDIGDGGASRFAGFLNHIKLNLNGGRVLPAKAYLSLAPVRERGRA